MPDGMPLVALAHSATGPGYQHGDEEQPGLRLCSERCAKLAETSPEKYRAIALAGLASDAAAAHA